MFYPYSVVWISTGVKEDEGIEYCEVKFLIGKFWEGDEYWEGGEYGEVTDMTEKKVMVYD